MAGLLLGLKSTHIVPYKFKLDIANSPVEGGGNKEFDDA